MNSGKETQKIWLTGASTGIGAAVARALLAAGHEVIVTARSLANLQPLIEAFPEQCYPLVLDLTDTDAVSAADTSLAALASHLDVVILNAGTCEYIDVAQFSSEAFTTVMGLNFSGAVNTLELALPLLRKSPRRPYIVGVSSMVTHLPLPRSEAYGASKAALEYLLESLRVDLARENFDVSIVRPGFVRTPLTDRNDFAMPFILSTDEAAQHIVRGLSSRKWIIQFPWQLVSIMTLIKWLPLKWQTGLIKNMTRSKTR